MLLLVWNISRESTIQNICITNLNVERASAARNKKRDSRCAIKSSRPSIPSTSGI